MCEQLCTLVPVQKMTEDVYCLVLLLSALRQGFSLNPGFSIPATMSEQQVLSFCLPLLLNAESTGLPDHTLLS